MAIPSEVLEEIDALLSECSVAPWTFEEESDGLWVLSPEVPNREPLVAEITSHRRADGKLISLLRNYASDMIAEAREAERLREQLAAVDEHNTIVHQQIMEADQELAKLRTENENLRAVAEAAVKVSKMSGRPDWMASALDVLDAALRAAGYEV